MVKQPNLSLGIRRYHIDDWETFSVTDEAKESNEIIEIESKHIG